MNENQKEIGKGLWSERYIAGLLLLLGFLLVIPGVLFYFMAQSSSPMPGPAFPPDPHVWGRNLLSAAVAITLLGLVLLEGMLRKAGDAILSRLGLACFALGAAMWLTVSALNLEGPWIDGLETYFIVLAFVGTALFGWSSLRTGLLPRWIGIAVILWALGMLLVTLPGNRGPFNYTLALLLIAIALLARRVRVPLQE